MLAVIGTRSITLIDHPLSSSPSTRRVANPLFQSRPGLTVTHAAWAPHAPAFLMILTSDATLRLYDVATRDDISVERLRLRVVVTNGSAPVSFAFARSSPASWASLAVYVITADGSIYVVAPIAPIGTRLPHAAWQRMRADAERHRDDATAMAAVAAETGGDAAGGPSNVESWPRQQAEMQLRFLDHVFEPTAAGDMVAVREFKPAPLLFQGPLFIEHDDDDGNNTRPAAPAIGTNGSHQQLADMEQQRQNSNSLTILNCGADIPPVLLRTSQSGHISVLIAIEPLEPQWFLSSQHPAQAGGIGADGHAISIETASDGAALEASEEYAACAAQVAPSLLCFERIALEDTPVSIMPLGSGTNADAVFVSTPHAVYSLRLSFVAIMSDVTALERSSCSVLSRILSTAPLQQQSGTGEVGGTGGGTSIHNGDINSTANNRHIIGLVSHYARHVGPVAIALTADCMLHATAPLRWVSHIDAATFPTGHSPTSRALPHTDSGRVFACSDLGKEANDLLKVVADAERRAGGFVAQGTLGKAADVARSSRVLEELERRVTHYTGSMDSSNSGHTQVQGKGQTQQQQSGVSDCLGELSSVLSAWSNALMVRVQNLHSVCTGNVANAVAQIAVCEAKTQRQLAKVTEVGELLDERIRVLMQAIDASKVRLSPAEAACLQKLRDRSRRLAVMRGRIQELSIALQGSRQRLTAVGVIGAATRPGLNTTTAVTVANSGQISNSSPLLSAGIRSTGTAVVSGSPMGRPPIPTGSAEKSSAGRSPFKHPSPARRLSFSRKEFGDGGPLAKKRAEWVESSTRAALSPADLQRIRVALEKHSEEIARAMHLESTLRKKLSVQKSGEVA